MERYRVMRRERGADWETSSETSEHRDAENRHFILLQTSEKKGWDALTSPPCPYFVALFLLLFFTLHNHTLRK